VAFNNGFFGKPLGNPKPKEDFEEPLILDIVEGVYLLEKGKIIVESDSKILDIKKLKTLLENNSKDLM
jgi:tRNA splicing endonuclease